MRVPNEPQAQATDAPKAPRPARAARGSTEAGDGADAKEILNIEEASAFLGVSTKTFQKVLREGEMPGRKVGREWKFWRRALAEWVGRGRSRDFLDSSDREESAAASPSAPPAAPAARRAAAAANGGRESGPARAGNGHKSLEAEED